MSIGLSDDSADYSYHLPIKAGQPTPVEARASHLRLGPHVATTIVRDWAPGDTRRCRLCPVCTADHAKSVCVITTSQPVPPGREWLFDSRRTRVTLG